jgi:hypothetical protein
MIGKMVGRTHTHTFSHRPVMVSHTSPHVSTSSLVYSVAGIASWCIRYFSATSARCARRALYPASWKPGWSASRSIPASSVRFAMRSAAWRSAAADDEGRQQHVAASGAAYGGGGRWPGDSRR